MNNVILVGRLTKDPELKYVGEKNVALTKFTLAVNREYKQTNKENKADFINIELWGKTAEICYKYLGKGRKIAVQGRIETDSYLNQNGEKRFVTKIRGEKFQFADSKRNDNEVDTSNYYDAKQIFEDVEKENKQLEELPF